MKHADFLNKLSPVLTTSTKTEFVIVISNQKTYF